MRINARPWMALLLGIVFAGSAAKADPMALAGFQPNTGGVYADFTNGALGFDVVGSANGTGQLAAADLLVNVHFT